MAKNALTSGAFSSTALVVVGWSSFIGSFIVESTIAVILLKLVARVLP